MTSIFGGAVRATTLFVGRALAVVFGGGVEVTGAAGREATTG